MDTVTISLLEAWTTGNVAASNKATQACPGNGVTCGKLIIPAGARAGQEFDIPFLSLVEGASFVHLRNATGQELNMAWGGNWAPHLPDQGIIIYAFPSMPAAGGITAMRFMLTEDQVAVGFVEYTYCGC